MTTPLTLMQGLPHMYPLSDSLFKCGDAIVATRSLPSALAGAQRRYYAAESSSDNMRPALGFDDSDGVVALQSCVLVCE